MRGFTGLELGVYMTSQRVDIQYWDGSAYQTAASLTRAGDTAFSSASFPNSGTSGDLNGDGGVNASDLQLEVNVILAPRPIQAS